MVASLMPLVLAFSLQEPSLPKPLGPYATLPRAAPMRLGRVEVWRIKRVAAPRVESRSMNGYTIRVAGKPVAIRPNPSMERVRYHEVGRDGSVLIHRWSYGISSFFEDSILYRGVDVTVSEGIVSHYRDRLDYAGATSEPGAGIGGPQTAPEAFVVEGGRKRALGPGSIRHWGGDGTFVIETPIDSGDRPSGVEMTEGAATRILRGRDEWRVRDYGFAGRTKDGTVVLVSGLTSDMAESGNVLLGKKDVARRRVLLWRDGRWVGHYQAPEGWRVAGLAPSGWVLMRRSGENPKEPDFKEMKREQAAAMLQRMMRSQEDAMVSEERDWRCGVFQAGALIPVSFPRPKGTEGLLWRETPYAYGPRGFRFSAFWGDDERCFRVAPR